MKKLSLLVVVFGLITLAGCWKKKEEAKPVETTPVATEVPAAPAAETPATPAAEAPAMPAAPAAPAAK